MVKIFLVLLLAHLIADFVTQTTYINENKKRINYRLYSKGLLYHVIHHFVLSCTLLFIFMEWSSIYIPVVIIITILHYFIDLAKIYAEEKIILFFREKNRDEKFWLHHLLEKKTTYFILDQFLHVLSIYVVLSLFQQSPSIGALFHLFLAEGQVLAGDTKWIMLGILFILITFASAHFIAVVMSDLQEQKIEDSIAATLDLEDEHMKQLKNKIHLTKSNFVINEAYKAKDANYTFQVQYQKYNNESENSRGKYIGILERILIMVFVVQNVFQGLALLIGMKTITRFKQFEDKSFAEYYLIGTLLSLTIGIAIAFAIRRIF
ncbi:DUF3307 domain-containing protein [Virgibacillus natechei]|uniref:DUF3307 domain-containing protein n=1 Tax=Virgibacillus sp. CBA3643 TaxID=2942278 RepID=UPI0035A36F78